MLKHQIDTNVIKREGKGKTLMGSVPGELSLDLGPAFVPKTISDFLKEVSVIADLTERISRVNSFVDELEEEMRKIDAFKRELPLCMLLLTDAIVVLKEESVHCEASDKEPVLEEFIPLKHISSDEDNREDRREKDWRDKKNWMSSVQLWHTSNNFLHSTDNNFDAKQNLKLESIKFNKKENQGDIFENYKNRTPSSTMMPFKCYTGLSKKEEELAVPSLSLLTPGIKNQREDSVSAGSRTSCSRALHLCVPGTQSTSLRNGPQPPQQQTGRKQRRCWSPDLHRRFVNALQQLGGSQAATPKQIRELMQVDGLTNDEVKSHLQKYRLHTRRPAGATTPANQSAVALGGLWMPQDHYGASSKATTSQSGSPQGPLQLAANGAGTSTTGGDSMEDDDDAKSEVYSWKGIVPRPAKVDV